MIILNVEEPMDNYDPERMFKQALFNVCLDYLESETLTEREVVAYLHHCIEFFWSGADPNTVRDFCIVRLKRSKEKSNG